MWVLTGLPEGTDVEIEGADSFLPPTIKLTIHVAGTFTPSLQWIEDDT